MTAVCIVCIYQNRCIYCIRAKTLLYEMKLVLELIFRVKEEGLLKVERITFLPFSQVILFSRKGGDGGELRIFHCNFLGYVRCHNFALEQLCVKPSRLIKNPHFHSRRKGKAKLNEVK